MSRMFLTLAALIGLATFATVLQGREGRRPQA